MKRQRVIAVHVAAWCLYLVFYSTLWREPHDTFIQALVKQFWLLPPKLFLVYITLLVLIPQFFLRRQYVAFLLTLTAASLVGGLFNQVLILYIIPTGVGVAAPGEIFWDFSRISKRMTYINSTMFFALTAEGIRMWYVQKEMNERLVKEKMAAELSLLKGQLQPHFFFNTLNNLYSLTLQKSDLAPPLILQLSDMMRYIINNSQTDRVALLDEVNFVRGYIGIETVRYSGKLEIKTSWPENMNDIRIPPLTLFPFVENAFKHGVAEEVGTAWMTIILKIEDDALSFIVRNSYPIGQRSKHGGIGLRNTQERLFIEYGGDMEFEVNRREDEFNALLRIKIR